MTPSRMMRAAITPAEWNEIRKVAIDLGVPLNQLLARWLREGLAKAAKP